MISPPKDQPAHDSAQELPSVSSVLQEKVLGHVNTLRQRTSKVPERYQAAEALADLGRTAQLALSALETALVRDESVHVRKSLARALGELGDIRALPLLRQVLENDKDQFVRMRAREALALLQGKI